MARGPWGSCRLLSRKFGSSSYDVPSYRPALVGKEDNPKKTSLSMERRDWENAICSVCMEFPHNAVLLLCSSHAKGCRPYMCDTSHRYSNCLNQFKKAYTKEASSRDKPAPDSASLGLAIPGWRLCESSEVMELACPLCRGQVKGWTVVGPAREYLNKRKRSCMHDGCSFNGSYKKLRRHVKAEHASARPRRVDPALEQKWKRLESERERDDVMSTIRSSMPGSLVYGDYVIEMSSDDDHDPFDGFFGLEDGEDSARSNRRSRRWHEIPGRGRDRRISRGDDFGRGSNRRISRSILRAIIQESARLARFRRVDGVSDGWDAGGDRSLRMTGAAADAADVTLSFPSEEEEDNDYLSYGNSARTDRRQMWQW